MLTFNPKDISVPFFRAFDDEAMTFDGTASNGGLSLQSVTDCKVVAIRFSSGVGRIRVTGSAATTSAGYLVEAGDVVMMTFLDAQNLSGIRSGSVDLVGWVTYYR